MAISQYDAVLVDMDGTGFTGYYKRGINLKLSDGVTVINVWKPGTCPYYNGEVYKDAMIQFSGNAKNEFTYQDMQRINHVIELAIDYLNKENENIIDREKESSYDHIKVEKSETKKTEAIKFGDLQVGGIYLDDKLKKWIFLGQGTIMKNGTKENKIGRNAWCEYMYMEYPQEEIIKVANNTYRLNSFFPHPDSYVSKKRFFKKIDQLDIDPSKPINIQCSNENFQLLHGVKPEFINERMDEFRGKIR